jgi:RNA polymerase sigma factor (sigma-70 family)
MNEYRVKISVRNNLLLTAIEEAGYSSQVEFAEACGVSLGAINRLCSLKEAPINLNGTFSSAASAAMEVLGACPSDLWTEEQLTMNLKQNSATLEVDKNSLLSVLSKKSIGENLEQLTPEEQYAKKQFKELMHKALDKLDDRHRKVLQIRFGMNNIDSQTLEEVGRTLDRNTERIRQMEANGLRKMRHPDVSKQIREAAFGPREDKE